MNQTVTAKCVGCGAKRVIRAYEIPDGEVPMCERCGLPMVAVSAATR